MLQAEEHLRLAYLAAMDITVWVPRGAGDPEPVVETPRVRERQLLPSGAKMMREALAPAAPIAAKPVPSADPLVVRPRPASGGHVTVSLAFAVAGDVLLIDENSPESDAPARERLLAAIAFALDGKSARIELQPFDWPPPGVPLDPAQTRDAVLARVRKRVQERNLSRIVLMGLTPASVLLGWDAQRFAQRDGGVQLIDGVDLPAQVTLASETLLLEPARKREAWRDIRGARR